MTSPEVRRASDVAELRSHLVRQWQPGGAFHRAASTAIGSLRDPMRAERYRDEATTERVGLQRCTLWYVERPMVDLLCTVKEATPPDVRPPDLVWPSDSGLVVFARPIPGTAIDRPVGGPGQVLGGLPMTAEDVKDNPPQTFHTTEVRAIMWNRAMLPDWPDRGGVKRIPCLSVHSYRWLDYGEGLDRDDLEIAQLLGEMTQSMLVQHADRLEFSDGTTFPGYTPEALAYARQHRDDDVTVTVSAALKGGFWAPMGHSDWPAADRLDTIPPWCSEGVMWASFVEDRQLIAALFTCLAQEGIASRVIEGAPRPVRKRAERQGIKGPSDVVVVDLRHPRKTYDHVPEAPEGATLRTHRWLVREHPRWQPCGPRRSERRLIIVPAHIKGPPGAPLVVKTKVNRWVR